MLSANAILRKNTLTHNKKARAATRRKDDHIEKKRNKNN